MAGAAGPVTIVTAGAAEPSQQQAITAALTAAATAFHRQARVLDVAPLPASDRAGLSVFVFELGLLIPSVIGGVGLFLAGKRFRIWWRIAAAALFALLAAIASAVVLDVVFGALARAILPLIGVGFLGSFAFVTFVAACQAVVGLPGTGVAALAFVFIGNAVSGGTVAFAFLPDGFRQVAPWLPNGAIVSAARDVVYLPDAGLHTRCSSWGSGWPGRWPCWPAWTCSTWPNAAARRNGKPRSSRCPAPPHPAAARPPAGGGRRARLRLPAPRWRRHPSEDRGRDARLVRDALPGRPSARPHWNDSFNSVAKSYQDWYLFGGVLHGFPQQASSYLLAERDDALLCQGELRSRLKLVLPAWIVR